VLGRRQPVAADLERMPYTACVLQEPLRLYPGAYAVDRWALHEDRVCGHVIPAGAAVVLSPYTMQRRADLWPEPERFDPDRFADGAKGRPRYAYFPFGGGAHQCIGEHHAMTQLRLVLPLVLQHLRFRRVPGHRLEHRAMFTLRPRDGIPLHVEAGGV
jgi:cytochrome P450